MPRALGHAVDAARADELQHARRRRVVRALDHRVDQAMVARAERSVAHARVVEVGDEQHRLQHARRGHRARDAPAPFAMLPCAPRSSHRPRACARRRSPRARPAARRPPRAPAPTPSSAPAAQRDREQQQPPASTRVAGTHRAPAPRSARERRRFPHCRRPGRASVTYALAAPSAVAPSCVAPPRPARAVGAAARAVVGVRVARAGSRGRARPPRAGSAARVPARARDAPCERASARARSISAAAARSA